MGFVIDLRNQKILSTIFANEFFSDLQFSQDAKLLFIHSFEAHNHGVSIDKINAWDIQKAQWAHSYWKSEFDEQSYIYPSVSSPAISPDGKRIAAGYGNLLQIRDVQTEELLQSFKGHTSKITSVAFSKDGSQLATFDMDGVVQLWNSQTGQRLSKFSLKLLETQGLKLSFSVDNKHLLAIYDDSAQQTIDLQTGQVQGPFIPELEPLAMVLHQQGYSQFGYRDVALTISPDGKTLAVSSGIVLLWDIQTQKLIAVLENPGNIPLRELQFDPSGRLLAGIADYQIVLWDTTSSDQPNLAQVFGTFVDVDWPKGLSFSANGRYFAVGRGGEVEIWNVETAQKVKTLQMNGNAEYVDDTEFLENDQSLYTLVEMEMAENDTGVNSQIQIWNIETSQVISSMPIFGHRPSTSAFRWPLFAFENGDNNQNNWIEIWNLETKTLKKIAIGYKPIFFSEHKDLLFLISSDENQFYIWNMDIGKHVYTSPQIGELPYLQYNLELLHASNFVALHGYRDGIVQLFDINAIIDEARQP